MDQIDICHKHTGGPMSPQPFECPANDLSPFCANDQLFTSNLAADNRPTCNLPDSSGLLASINHEYEAGASALSLVIVGLTLFNAGHSVPDEHTCQLASLVVAAKLEHCLRNYGDCYNGNRYRGNRNADKSESDTSGGGTTLDNTATAETFNSSIATPGIYRLTTLQFAILPTGNSEHIGTLCQTILTALDQPLYIGDQILATRPHIGIALSQQQQRPESLILSARSALFDCRQQ
jgi:hypothetical protein